MNARSVSRLFFFVASVATAALSLPLAAAGATFTLQWDPNTEPDLTGYKLYYGTASRTYSSNIDVGNVTTYQLSSLQDGVTYFFAVTARDQDGNESTYSNEVTGRWNLPPQASASANPTSGHAPLNVSFTGSGTDSDGTIVGYSWNFGDGGISSSQNPSHNYSAAGTYTAVLTVRDNDGATGTRSVQVSVSAANQPPVAQASANPASGHAPLNVSFTGSGTDSDGTIVGYSWNFGDGGSATSQNPSHLYASAGTFTAVLTVRDNDGATGTRSVQISVSAANQPPTVTANAAPTRGAPPLMVSFTGSASDPDGTVASYLWNFGDGNSASGPNSVHTYDSEGTYTATLTVADDDGATSIKSFTIRVNGAPSAPKGLKIGKNP